MSSQTAAQTMWQCTVNRLQIQLWKEFNQVTIQVTVTKWRTLATEIKLHKNQQNLREFGTMAPSCTNMDDGHCNGKQVIIILFSNITYKV